MSFKRGDKVVVIGPYQTGKRGTVVAAGCWISVLMSGHKLSSSNSLEAISARLSASYIFHPDHLRHLAPEWDQEEI